MRPEFLLVTNESVDPFLRPLPSCVDLPPLAQCATFAI